MVKKEKRIKKEKFEGEDKRKGDGRVDVTELEFDMPTVLKIIIVVAFFVSTAVFYQLQIQGNSKDITDIQNSGKIDVSDLEKDIEEFDRNIEAMEKRINLKIKELQEKKASKRYVNNSVKDLKSQIRFLKE